MEPGSNQSTPFNPYYSPQVGEPTGRNYDAQLYAQQLTPFQPTPGGHTFQMIPLNPQTPYMHSTNNLQTPGMNHVTVTSPPRTLTNLVYEIFQFFWIVLIILLFIGCVCLTYMY